MIPLIDIECSAEAIFKERPNRYVALVDVPKLGLCNELVHVHDPGRLQELLYPGNRIIIKKAENPNRKTGWDVIAADANGEWILIHSGYHRKIMESILVKPAINPLGELVDVKAEVTYKKSRIDFFVKDSSEKEWWIEGKGCSLTVDGLAMFPDAPSKRATKHLTELMELQSAGYGTSVYISVFRKSNSFRPKHETDPLFAETFYRACDAGVKIFCLQLCFIDGTIYYSGSVPILDNVLEDAQLKEK